MKEQNGEREGKIYYEVKFPSGNIFDVQVHSDGIHFRLRPCTKWGTYYHVGQAHEEVIKVLRKEGVRI